MYVLGKEEEHKNNEEIFMEKIKNVYKFLK